jgi:glycosyltransferase involved in cell wall biosynthesis
VRILVHDYAGHPFQVQLSRSLARRGHEVLHAYSRSIQTPRGRLEPDDGDPATFGVVGIELSAELRKYSMFTRRRQDLEHGALAVREIDGFRPETVLSGNTWIDAQSMLLRHCRTRGIRFTYWLQDLLGVGMYRILGKRFPVFGHAVGRLYRARERRLLARSDAVVAITEDFRELLEGYGVAGDRIHVIENWAPLGEMPRRPKDNGWARKHALQSSFCFLYSGTMGMKHNPELLVRLAQHFCREHEVKIVVVSEGLGADWLAEQKRELGLDNLVLHGFQPFEDLPDVLAAADVLVAVLEPEAGVFSVPSKVLSYLCAERPLLLAVPPENLVWRIVERAGAGLTAASGDADGFVDAADRLYRDRSLRESCAREGRSYAESHFDIEKITDRFEPILAPRR